MLLLVAHSAYTCTVHVRNLESSQSCIVDQVAFACTSSNIYPSYMLSKFPTHAQLTRVRQACTCISCEQDSCLKKVTGQSMW